MLLAHIAAPGALLTALGGAGGVCQPSWIPAFGGAPGVNDIVASLAVFDDGGGPALYAGGLFTSAGGAPAGRIAKWDGTSWSPLGSGMSGFVYALAGFDDGGGPALYAGGGFTSAGGVTVNRIAKWDGASWSALAGGLSGGGVSALAVFDDGGGPALYAGGEFTGAGGVAASRIAKWDGTSWSALGSGMEDFSSVLALTVFDDGSGPALYAAGTFASAGGVAANHVAKWDGTSWSALGSGTSGFASCLAVFDDGGGPALFAGGSFATAGGVEANHIAKWDGTSWSALGSGVIGFFVNALTALDDGSGPALFAGGQFTVVGGVDASRVAKWDGTSWSALGSGVSSQVWTLAGFDDGGGAALYTGGEFLSSPAGDPYLARWGCTGIGSLPGCAGNPAALEALASSAPLGAPLPLRITGSSASSGRGRVFFGAPGVDAGGCGLPVPGVGELLLAPAPAPLHLASAPVAGGTCDLSLLVPTLPALSGVTVHLQGALADFALPQPIELTNALAVTLGP